VASVAVSTFNVLLSLVRAYHSGGREAAEAFPDVRTSHCSSESPISLFLAQSGQRMSSPSVMKPFPTMDDLQAEQTKQSLCQWRPSKAMKRVPPMPADVAQQRGCKRRGEEKEIG
jgi:hypothetical protein